MFTMNLINALLCLLITGVWCGSFAYYDSSMQLTDFSPQLIVDKMNIPMYVITRKPQPRIWSYSNRTVVNPLVPAASSWAFTFNGNFLVMVNASDVSVWKHEQHGFAFASQTHITNGSSVVFSRGGDYMVAFTSSELLVYRLDIQGYMQSFQNVSTSKPIFLRGFFCANNSLVMATLQGEIATFARTNRNSSYYRIASWPFRFQSIRLSWFCGSDNANVIVVGTEEAKLIILIWFKQKYVELEPIDISENPAQLKVNSDGSGFAWVDSKGKIYQFTREMVGDASRPSNCVWYYSAYVCNCSNDVNSLSSDMDTVCQCRANYVWKGYMCRADCSTPHAVGTTNDTLSCVCEAGYSWNVFAGKCYMDQVTTNLTARISCSDHFEWTGSQCQVDCSTYEYAYSNNSSVSCACNGSRVWLYGRGCVPDCSSLSWAYPRAGNSEECQCVAPYQWDYQLGLCRINCQGVQWSFGERSHSECHCLLGYFWRDVDKRCAIDCQKSASTALFIGSQRKACSCALGYQWNDLLSRCVLNCNEIANSDNSSSVETCTCPSNQTKKNLRDCPQNCKLEQCKCQSGYAWNQSTLSCNINCVLYPNALFNQNVKTCSCHPRYYWDSRLFGCVINCSKVSYSLTNDSLKSCSCQPKSYWDGSDCVVNCSDIANASKTTSPLVCSCSNNLVFSQKELSCALNCTGIGYTGNTISQYKCECKSGYHWKEEDCREVSYLGLILGGSIGGVALFMLVGVSIWVYCKYFRTPEAPAAAAVETGSPVLESDRKLYNRDSISKESVKQKTFDQDCTICLNGQSDYKTLCLHYFHLECVKQWLSRRGHCPNCRSPMSI